MKVFGVIVMMLVSTLSFSQELKYRNGQFLNSAGTYFNKKEMRELLAANPKQLTKFNGLGVRRNVGGFMIGFGGGLILGDLAVAMFKGAPYPSALTYVGAGAALVSIPLMTGHRSRIRKFVDGYNKEISGDQSLDGIENIEFVVNQNGAGLRLQF